MTSIISQFHSKYLVRYLPLPQILLTQGTGKTQKELSSGDVDVGIYRRRGRRHPSGYWNDDVDVVNLYARSTADGRINRRRGRRHPSSYWNDDVHVVNIRAMDTTHSGLC